MSKIVINVTEEDINNGERADPMMCPVGRAVKRVLPHTDFGVLHGRIRVKRDYYTTPIEVTNRIKRFDYDRSMEPFTFELDIKE